MWISANRIRTAKTDRKAFDGKIEFGLTLIPYDGDDSWVEKTIIDAQKCLCSDNIPASDPDCDYCNYLKAIAKIKINK